MLFRRQWLNIVSPLSSFAGIHDGPGFVTKTKTSFFVQGAHEKWSEISPSLFTISVVSVIINKLNFNWLLHVYFT